MLFSGTVYENVENGLVGEKRRIGGVEKRRLAEETCKASNVHDSIHVLPKVSGLFCATHCLSYTWDNRAMIPKLVVELDSAAVVRNRGL